MPILDAPPTLPPDGEPFTQQQMREYDAMVMRLLNGLPMNAKTKKPRAPG
jgi:hypothetical protein